MKMTVELDDRLVREAEAFANQKGEPLAELIGRALRDYVMGKRGINTSFDPLTKGGRPIPGVDIDNRMSLYDCMERRDCLC